MDRKLLDQRHPEYRALAGTWADVDALVRGVDLERFLVKRPKERQDVYAARCQRLTYQNILGTAVGWYRSAMFREAPAVVGRRNDVDIELPDFYATYLANCNRRGTSFTEIASDVFQTVIQFGRAYVLVDLPRSDAMPVTLAEQRATGALDPYLICYDPRQVLNWGVDGIGDLTWVVIYAETEEQVFGAEPMVVERWYYFDRTTFTVYEARGDKRDQAVEVASGSHALAAESRVPLECIHVPDSLWLASRARHQAIEHLRTDNEYGWGLFMANLPVPVITGQFESPPTISETAFIQLSENGKFEYAEPSGVSFLRSAERIAALREEIYRAMYLQAQGRSTEATPAAQSGLSKEMDMMPGRDALNGLGNIMRAGMRRLMLSVSAARGDDLDWDVRGFHFDDSGVTEELSVVERGLALEIPSDTLERALRKRAGRCLLRDEPPTTVQAVEQEIDAAPGREERAAAARAAAADAFRRGLPSAG